MATIVYWMHRHRPFVLIDNDLIRYLFSKDQ